MLQMHKAQMSSASQLRRGLSQRQLNMIALGGVIGAGLFVGSGVIIGETGPGAFITYAVCGVFVVLVMRMLGEMARTARSSWLRLELVNKARAAYPIPVTHVVSRQRAVDLAAAPLRAN
jgi:L-asparagine transporter-like permease